MSGEPNARALLHRGLTAGDFSGGEDHGPMPERLGAPRDAAAQMAVKRIDASREALRDALILQAQVTEQIRDDQGTLQNLAEASQGADGALAAQQATNELLAFQSAQNSRLQSLLVAQNRAEAIERARQMEVLAAARAEHQRFFKGATDAYPGVRPWN